MSAIDEMRGRMTARLAELRDLHGVAERSDEQEARLDALLAEVNDLRQRIDRQAAAEAALRDAGPPVTRVGAMTAAAEGEAAAEPADLRSPGRRFTESEQYRDALRHGTAGRMAPVRYDGLLARGTVDDEVERRAVVHSGTAPASMLLPQVLPTIYRGAEAPLVLRDVLLNLRTTSDSITVMQESGFTNNAAETAEATTVSTGLKPESALTFTEVSFPVRTIAHWVPITRQMLDDIPMMESYVNGRLLTGLERREDNQFINGDGTGANLTGLLATSGIQDLNAAYWTANPVANAGTSVENVNRVLRAKTKVATTGGASASFVLMNPSDYEAIQTTADANRQYLFAGPSSAGGVPTLWGLPVVQSQNIAAKTALVGDGTMAAVADRMVGSIYTTDSHSDFFTRNLFVILAEERVALPVFRAAAFAKVALV